MSLRLPIAGAVAFVLLALVVGIPTAFAYDAPPNDGYVTDATDRAVLPSPIISSEQDATLEQRLELYKQQTSNEIAVLIVQSLQGEAIEEVAIDIGRKWGVGSQKNNGILLLIAYNEREVRIEVGYGLEGAVPDIVAKGIIDTDIVPNFRDGDYYSGVVAALDALEKHIGNEYTAERYAQSDSNGFGFSAYGIVFIFILLQWLIAVLGRTKSWWLGGVLGGVGGIILVVIFTWWLSIPVLVALGLLLDFFVSKNYHKRGKTSWWAGGGWGPGGSGGRFGGGGGFGGFGGGSFGGGGASGRW